MVVSVALSVLLFWSSSSLCHLQLASEADLLSARYFWHSIRHRVLTSPPKKSPVEVLGASEKILHGSTSCEIKI